MDFLGMTGGAKFSILLYPFLILFFSLSSFFFSYSTYFSVAFLLHGVFRFPEIAGDNYFAGVVDGADADEHWGGFLLGSLEASGT